MPITIKVTVTGDLDAINLCRTIQTQIEPRVIKPHIHDYAEDLRTEMISHMHTDSGDMIRSTHTRPVQEGRAVTVGVGYAEDENQRPGRKRGRRGTGQGTSHNFVEPSMRKLAVQKDRELINRLELFLRTA